MKFLNKFLCVSAYYMYWHPVAFPWAAVLAENFIPKVGVVIHYDMWYFQMSVNTSDIHMGFKR